MWGKKLSSIKIADKPEGLVFEDQFDRIFGHIYFPIITGSNYMKNSGKLHPSFLIQHVKEDRAHVWNSVGIWGSEITIVSWYAFSCYVTLVRSSLFDTFKIQRC